jgi:His/Glu/Gln/Arg/opine family amino acid ABC transporter permease subunit
MNVDFGLMPQYASVFWNGVLLTLLLTGAALVLSFPLGLAGALIRVFAPRPFRIAVTAYVEVLRNIPFLVVLYMFYFGLTGLGLKLDPLVCGIVALALNSAAYTVEIFRGGLAGIHSSQYMAAASLGMRPPSVFRYVIYPQLLRVCLPALGNQVVSVFLGSALVSTIGVAEITYQALSIGALTFRYFEVFTVAAVLYVVLAQVVGLVWRGASRRMLRVVWS